MSDVIKAERHAVQQLQKAVVRYAERLRDAAAVARREAAVAQARAQQVVDGRRAVADRAAAELEHARQAAGRAPEAQRAQAQQAIAAAQQRLQRALHELHAARRAAATLAAACSDLVVSLQAAEAAVSEQGSAASAILGGLQSKLAEISGDSFGGALRGALTTIGVAAEVLVGTVDVATVVGNASQGALPTAQRVTSVSQREEQRVGEQQQLWKEVEVEQRKRSNGGRAGAGE
ncbi:hypothetical protein ACI78T_06720 [Blastococcus sp. SYSU D00922]